MEIIKRILNYLFPEKKKVEIQHMQNIVLESKKIIHPPIFYFPSHKMSFREQQLIGKVLTFCKNRFRIHETISVTNKFKYYVEQLI